MSNAKSNGDVGARVIQVMLSQGVATIPRNFEVYYAGLSGTSPKIKTELAALGPNPTQKMIDEVGNRHFPERIGLSVVQKAQSSVYKQMNDLQASLQNNSESLTRFNDVVENAERHISQHQTDASGQMMLKLVSHLLSNMSVARVSNESLIEHIASESIALEASRHEMAEYRKMAFTDQLTGIGNRRAFDEVINAIYDKQNYDSWSLILMDVDHFKKVNDTYGHPFGDRILQMVAQQIKQNVRDAYVSRYGGEEFAVILDNVSHEKVLMISDRIRLAIEKMPIQVGERKYPNVTVSLGVCMSKDAENANDLISKADKALYASKRAGRNQTTAWHPETLTFSLETGGARQMYKAG